MKIGAARSISLRQAVVEKYCNHILKQWLDRQGYWFVRALSHTYFEQNVILGQRFYLEHSLCNLGYGRNR